MLSKVAPADKAVIQQEIPVSRAWKGSINNPV